MKMVSFVAKGRTRAGVLVEDLGLCLDIAAVLSATPDGTGSAAPRTMRALIEMGETGFRLAGRAERIARELSVSDPTNLASSSFLIGEVQFLPPVPDPSKVIAIGLNYRDHCEEQNVPLPEYPTVFAKFPSCLVGHGHPIVKPAETNSLDYEAELAFVVGRVAKDVPEEQALDCVFGYMCFNDVTARDIQKGEKQWVRGKSFDTFGPCGPYLVTADEVGEPQNLCVECRVNGEVRQKGNTRDMVFGVAHLLSRLSRSFTLLPGDIVTTGTPAGVGIYSNPPRLLQPGDEVEVTIERLGTLRNRVEEAES
ncbi:MAG: fumarylacetoacetate hydrolase family protein [Fimbriimonadia bacterium]|jgi:2-keto-4-pentenoate hydratase/2-oxohepta-3-ene-1,7-dioic acid hydratase in catechol pathway